jgi:hypothetical protein
MRLSGEAPGTRCGIVLLGREYAWAGLVRTPTGVDVVHRHGARGTEDSFAQSPAPAEAVDLRLSVDADGVATFAWRAADLATDDAAGLAGDNADDTEAWHDFPSTWAAVEGHWIGAEVGLFAAAPPGTPADERGGALFGPVRVTVAGKDA